MKKIHVALAVVVASGLGADAVEAQRYGPERNFPLAPTNSANNIVAPYFDGWYVNPDGTYTLSFGFMNRNEEDLIEIPLGPNNFIEPAEFDGVQPTSFPVVSYGGFGGPRERGVFGVVIPADYRGDVWWTLTTGNYTTKVPGRLVSPGPVIQGAYELSTEGQASGSMRPGIRFTPTGEYRWGQAGPYHPTTFQTRVGQPINVTFWTEDRAVGRELNDVNMSIWKHQGPVGGEITLTTTVPPPPAAGGGGRGGRGGGGGGGAAAAGAAGGAGAPAAAPAAPPAPTGPRELALQASVRIARTGAMPNQGQFTAAFNMPGEYVLRIRIDNFTTGDSSMGNACCWSNGYVRVNVTQ